MAVSLQFNFPECDQHSVIPISVLKKKKNKQKRKMTTTKEISNSGTLIHYFIAISSPE